MVTAYFHSRNKSLPEESMHISKDGNGEEKYVLFESFKKIDKLEKSKSIEMEDII